MNSPPVNNVQEFKTAGPRLDRRIGKILLDARKITLEDVERILHVQKEQNIRFGDAAKQLGLITDGDIQQILSQQFDYPYMAAGQGPFGDELIAAYMPFSPAVEALRSVRSQLMLRWFDADHRSLAVVGTENGTGTSYVAANLAVVFSQLGERTLLIDANLRAPRQQDIFQLSAREGLTDVISGRVNTEVVEKVAGFYDLSVLGAGTVPPNPLELLARPAFDNVLGELAGQFDVILIDTAPGAVTVDAQPIAAKCGGALMVVRPNHTRLSDATALREMIMSAGATVIGAVVNRF